MLRRLENCHGNINHRRWPVKISSNANANMCFTNDVVSAMFAAPDSINYSMIPLLRGNSHDCISDTFGRLRSTGLWFEINQRRQLITKAPITYHRLVRLFKIKWRQWVMSAPKAETVGIASSCWWICKNLSYLYQQKQKGIKHPTSPTKNGYMKPCSRSDTEN